MSEQEVLNLLLKQTREQSLNYFHKIPTENLHGRLHLEGKALNSPFWILAHLAVSSNFLLLHATGGDRLKLPWARQFGLGSTVPAPEDCPPLQEVLDALAEIQTRALAHIAAMSSEELSLPTTTGTAFGGVDTRRHIIGHCIRHEASHAGHLAWLAKAWGAALI